MKTPIVLALASVLLMACSTQPEEITPVTDAPEATFSEITLEPFTFVLPEGWEVLSKGYDEVSFSVPDDQYEVTLVMYLREEGANSLPLEGTEVETTDEGIQMYSNGCSGIGCGSLAYDGTAYFYSFDINSNEAAPENLDGIWAPHTDADLDAFIATVHLAK